MSARTRLFLDVLERAFFTWLEVFLGILVVAPEVFEDTAPGRIARLFSAAQAAGLSAIPAALAVLKGFAASMIGERDSAAALPSDVD